MCSTGKMIDYRILYSNKSVTLNAVVKKLLDEGWTILSELETHSYPDSIDYIQPMVLYEQEE